MIHHAFAGSGPCQVAFTTCPPIPRNTTIAVSLRSDHKHVPRFRYLKRPRIGTERSSSHARFSLSLSQGEKQKPHAGSERKNENGPFRFKSFRLALSMTSLVGVAETCYLTLNKFLSSPGAICSSQGCLDVLTGPFSTFFGIPLSLLGVLAYGMFAFLSIWPLTANDEEREIEGGRTTVIPAEQIFKSRDAATRPLLLSLSTCMVIFSAYLMWLLHFIIQSMCPFCIFSAVLSTTLFVVTVFGRAVPSLRSAFGISAGSAFIATGAAALMFFVSLPAHIRAQPPSEPQSPPTITMRSTRDSLRIAGKLSVKKAKMYGAYWCSHCFDQKQRFGKRAFTKLEYIECDKHGVNSRYQLCRDKRIPGYPTWEIDGELYPGEIDLPELERLADEKDAKM